MMRFNAPYPAIEDTLFLPNPEFRDSERIASTAKFQQTLSKKYYTYIFKNITTKILVYTFNVTRLKFTNIRLFYKDFGAEKIQIIDHDGNIRIGYFLNNPLTSSSNRRGVLPINNGIQPLQHFETFGVSFEFETTE